MVNVGKIPGKIYELPFKRGKSIESYFADIEVTNFNSLDIQVNGSSDNVDRPLADGDTVLAVAKVKGN
jgi:hypothetical protein